MTVTPPDDANLQSSEERVRQEAFEQELLRSLRRKEGNWVTWGQACQQLQKAGYTPQQIFEETGFEPSQQNQVIVAAQVYQSIASGGASGEVLARFERTGSDTLYEFRILAQSERMTAAAIVVEKGIDSEGAHEVAKALKEFSRLSHPPREFAEHPSDAVAYYYWKLARQQADLQSRSRLIAQGLRFTQSETARQQVESLLTDFTIARSRPAPRLPFYRLESADEQPRILAVVGKLPLTVADLQAVPLVENEGLFHMVKFSGTGAWVALPGWQIVRNAEDPVMLLAESHELPSAPDLSEEVLVTVDRAQRDWNADSYFVVDQAGQLQIDWFEESPDLPILGRVILVLRPKKVLDEDFNKELWQIEE
ncbi:MAG: phosphate/phosphite/phosphonate ABC transporter substrate-binding protein [Cyanobacteria bacterium RU_5_0]|nr:phosphate/phosphite/phosphonate ABC transporter substrate-binding protein [Cyanobacteria bacterium RU_5_0]